MSSPKIFRNMVDLVLVAIYCVVPIFVMKICNRPSKTRIRFEPGVAARPVCCTGRNPASYDPGIPEGCCFLIFRLGMSGV